MRKTSHHLLALACCAALVSTAAAAQPRYRVTVLPSLGGSTSRGNSLNDLGVAAGYSTIPGNAVRHATVWHAGRVYDLGTLGDPATTNSTVAWPVKNLLGLYSGISETGESNPLGESWSCAAFFGTFGQSKACLGFVSVWGVKKALQPFAGGYNSFATGTNNLGRTVGWAETGIRDTSCADDSDQVLQFKPAVWDFGSDRPHELPLLDGDSSGAATALNDRGQIVGISGDCDQAVGRGTARHAVLWRNGRATDLGDLGQDTWNTPGAINQRGDVVGFAGTVAGDPDSSYAHAFLKPHDGPIRDLGLFEGDLGSVATGINEWGQVVGYTDSRAFLWQHGELTALNDLAPDFDGNITFAGDIDDLGRITGRAVLPDGSLVAIVATPVGGHR